VRPKIVVLVSVDSDAFLAIPVPLVFLVDLDAQQVLHDIGDPCIMVAFDPHDFNVALRVRELADVTDELPVFAREPRKIEVLENVAEENEAFEFGMFQEMQKFGCQGYSGAEVNVANDERFAVHDPLLIVS